MTMLTPPDVIWIGIRTKEDGLFVGSESNAQPGDAEYLLATPARRAADELVEALGDLIDLWSNFQDSHRNQEQAYYKLVKGKYDRWGKAMCAVARAREES